MNTSQVTNKNSLGELRSATITRTENSNQKGDLEFSFQNDEIKILNTKSQAIIFTVENSQWDTELLDQHFPNWKENPMTFSTEPYLKEEFQIS